MLAFSLGGEKRKTSLCRSPSLFDRDFPRHHPENTPKKDGFANIKRHYESKHASFSATFPVGSIARKDKIEALKLSYSTTSTILTTSSTAAEKATAASLRVTWELAKKGKPFVDAELVKVCTLGIVEELFAGDKHKDDIVNRVKQVQLSDSTAARRLETLYEDSFSALLAELKCVDYMSVAADESTDATDTAQLSVFVIYFNGELFKEELLCLLPLKSNTTGEAMYNSMKSFFDKNSLELDKINLLVTDGEPSMIGRKRGLASRLMSDHPAVNSLHCIIHQTVLCAKLSGEMKGVMDTVIKIVNHIRSTSSLQHRLFKMLLQEQEAQYSDLLQHNDVRWLSRGRVLQRFFALRKEITEFLSIQKTKKADEFSQFMQDQESVALVAFLCDITNHLNNLNLQLQGGDSNVGELFEKVSAFQTTLGVFVADIEGKKLHFPTLHDVPTNGIVLSRMVALLKNLSENFRSRFHNFKIPQQLLLFVRNPFAVAITGSCPAEAKNAVPAIDEGAFQLELVQMQANDVLKAKFREERLCEFWAHSVHQYPNSKRLAIHILTMFGSTYICESGFSVMNLIKDKKRNRLTDSHLNQCLHIALTSQKPNFSKLSKEMRCVTSHSACSQ
ncbi:zinc finger BED domain-containing protein 5-like [Brachyhypopomus gauderio]|uniref:zinc finger BED domain-containing protein 5-like n=1 Tax=Brachyhypopomus gauderio TaxID=698409 RepID=UPI0040421A04